MMHPRNALLLLTAGGVEGNGIMQQSKERIKKLVVAVEFVEYGILRQTSLIAIFHNGDLPFTQ